MSDESFVDPLAEALSELPPVSLRESCDRRVRRRCHHLLAERRRRSEPRPRPIRLADGLVAAGVAFYLVAVVSTAARLLDAALG